jgi:tetratricopeptide (TPR) repeat protein
MGLFKKMKGQTLSQEGMKLYQMRRFVEAGDLFSQAVQACPELAEAWSQWGLCRARLGDLEGAIQHFRTALSLPLPWVAARDVGFNLGKALVELGRYREAVECLGQTIRKDRNFTPAYNERGGALCKLGEKEADPGLFEQALRDFDQAIDMDPRDPLAYFNRAVAKRYLHPEAGVEAVETDLKTFQRLAPAGHPLLKDVAVLLNEAAEPTSFSPRLEKIRAEETTAAWKKIVELNTEEKYQEAIQQCDRLLEKNVGIGGVWDEKAFALFALGKPAEALDCCLQGLQKFPAEARLWCTKGTLLDELERPDEAVGAYEKYVALAPPEFAENVERVKARIAQLR